MFIDRRLNVSRQQAIPNGTALASTDTIDLGSARLLGPGEPMWWVLAARVGLAADANPTFDFSIQTDDADTFGSPVTLYSHPQLTAFAAGARLVIPHPWSNKRHLRLWYDLGGTNPTLTLDAWLTNQDPTSWMAMADGL